MLRVFLSTALLLVGTPLLTAQLSGKASPNPAAPGTTISVTLDATRALTLFGGLPGGPGGNPIGGIPGRPCELVGVRQGSVTGPVVYVPTTCGALPAVVPGGPNPIVTWPGTVAGGVPAPAGHYFFEFTWADTLGAAGSHFIPVRIDDPNLPTPPVLAVNGMVQVGGFATLDLSAPTLAGAPYFLAMSFTTNTGQNLFGIGLDLANDPLFNLSFPIANAGIFSGMVGFLTGTGSGSGVALIPNLPGLRGVQIATQGAVLDPNGLVRLTNSLTCPIQ